MTALSMDYRQNFYDPGAQYMGPRPSTSRPQPHSPGRGTPQPPTIRKDPDPSLAHLPSQDRSYYYSSSDADSDRDEADFHPPTSTNRGNKLKRGARDARNGRLGGWPKFGVETHRPSKRTRFDLTPTLSLTARRDLPTSSVPLKAVKLPAPPRNPIDLMTSPTILRTFAAPQSHLPTLALSATGLIEADAALLRVLSRVCDVLRGDRVPFVADRVIEVKAERKRAVVEAKRRAEEEATRGPPVSAVRMSKSRSTTPDVEQEVELEPAEEPVIEPEVAEPEAVEAVVAETAVEPALEPVKPDEKESEAMETDDKPKDDIIIADALPEAEGTVVEGAMDVDPLTDGAPAADDQPTRSSSPSSETGRRRSGRRAAAKATAANATLSRERSPTAELVDADSENMSDSGGVGLLAPVQPGLASGLRSAEMLVEVPPDLPEGGHLPPSLRRLANPDTYVRSLFITESAAVPVPDSAAPLDTPEQEATLINSLMELNRFFADSVEYRERLGEIRDGALGVERRRKGLFAILKVLASDALTYEELTRV